MASPVEAYPPLPTHPGLAASQPRPQLAGALSALSSLLLPPSGASAAARRPHASSSNGEPSLLERRRGDAASAALRFDAFERPRWTSDKARGKRRMRADADDDEEELPESPLGLPGAWVDNLDERRALLLPPPYLDGRSTTRESLSGVLGTKRDSLAASRARRQARLYAKDRPPRPVFPHSLLSTASKLVSAIGPPGGLDSGPFYRSWNQDDPDALVERESKERRMLSRAERGLKGFEFGERLAQKLADRLRKEQSGQKEKVDLTTEDLDEVEETPALSPPEKPNAGLTPMSVFGFPLSPPLPAFAPLSAYGDVVSIDTQPPDRPHLRPFTAPESEPSPFPLTPLTLAPDQHPLDQSFSKALNAEEDYFSVPRRRKNSRAPSSPAPKPTSHQHHPFPSQKDLEPSKSSFIPLVSAPLSHALSAISRRAQSHRDVVIWVLTGHATASTLNGLDGIGGLIGAVLHLVGFTFFVLVHMWELMLSTWATGRSTVLFLHWTSLNLRGKTELSVVVRDYFRLCRSEWDAVAADDGEPLSIGSAVLGMLEICAVQAMSKERWLIDGPGQLALLNGDDADGSAPNTRAAPVLRRRSTKRRPTIDRPELGRRRTTRRWVDDVGEGDSLLVTGGKDSILEGEVLDDSFDPLVPASYTSPRTAPLITEDDESLPSLDLDSDVSRLGLSFPPRCASPTRKTPSSPPLLPVPDKSTPLKKLLKTLKRHARLATASYGLHSYIVEPDFLTPSAETLPHKVFGHLGRVGHQDVLHVAIQRHYDGLPSIASTEGLEEVEEELYAPQFYLLRDDANGEIVVVVRGTQSLADVRTDLEASMEDVKLPALDGEGKVTYRVHAGILGAAKRLLDDQKSALFTKLRTVLEEHQGYAVVFCGHSLGAALASTLAVLVAEYMPPNTSSGTALEDGGIWTTTQASGLPPGRAVRSIAFAQPTFVDPELGKRCALGAEPLVLSVSLSCDIVSRMGVTQVREIRRALGRLAKTRRKFLQRRKAGEHGVSEILGHWWRWKRLGGGVGGGIDEEDEEQTPEQRAIEEKAWVWRQAIDGVDEDAPSRERVSTVPAGRLLHIDRLPRALETKRRSEVEAELDDLDDDVPVWGLYSVDKSRAWWFCAMPLLEADLVKNHLPKEYLDAIDSL